MSIKLEPSGNFSYNFMLKGYREHLTLNCKSKKEAIAIENERKTIVNLMLENKIAPDERVKKFLDKQNRKNNKIYTLNFLCDALKRDYKEKNNTSIHKIQTHIDFFISYFKSDRDVKTINEDDIIEMIGVLETHKNKKGEYIGNATINRYMSTLKRGYNVLNNDKKINLNYYPFKDERLKKRSERKKKIITIPKEAERDFFNAFPIPQNHIVELYFNLGLRISNILNLNKNQIDLINKRIILKPAENKGRKEINLKLNKRALEIILLYYDKADYYIFTHPSGKYKGERYKSIRKSWKTAALAIGLQGSTPHDGRRTFGTKIYKKNKDILLAQKLLYHSDPKTTLAYLGIEQEEMDAAIDSLND